jgi:hypothetical protein
VKIRAIVPPQPPLSEFDPGDYLSGLDFYETDEPISEKDRGEFAQFIHFLAFLALRSGSARWDSSTIARDSTAFQAVRAHFDALPGWGELVGDETDLEYPRLANFLLERYPPAFPTRS